MGSKLYPNLTLLEDAIYVPSFGSWSTDCSIQLYLYYAFIVTYDITHAKLQSPVYLNACYLYEQDVGESYPPRRVVLCLRTIRFRTVAMRSVSGPSMVILEASFTSSLWISKSKFMLNANMIM